MGAQCAFSGACASTPVSGLLRVKTDGKLEALRGELPAGIDVYTSTDVKSALRANLIVAATSSPDPLLDEADLENGTIVCDIGYPKNLAYSSRPQPGVLAFSGGLAEMPFDLDIAYYTRLPTPRLMCGCYCEAMVLALTGRYESYSIGRGRVSMDKMEAVLDASRMHGFQPAPPYRGTTPISNEALEDFLKATGSLMEAR